MLHFIFESAIINGNFFSKKTTFQSDLIVNGDASLEEITISGNALFRGQVNAKNSSLNSVELFSYRSVFDNCHLKTLVIQAFPFNTKMQRIDLTNHTTIAEDVIFQAGKGEVYCDSTSIVQGNIMGGSVVQTER